MSLLVIIIFAQILAISVHAYLLWYEKKYCGHCNWWWDTGAVILLVISSVPILGLFASIVGCADCMRNVTKELSRDN